MRSEDLSGIPESIEAWRVGELLEGLGFKPGSYKHVAEILIEPRQIVVQAYATNEEGRRYFVPGAQIEVQDLGDKDSSYVAGQSDPAMHTISIPFVGGWEKPDPISRCAAVLAPDSWALNCERGPEHSGEHLAHFEGTEQRW